VILDARDVETRGVGRRHLVERALRVGGVRDDEDAELRGEGAHGAESV
jgi:hypothetical protein